MKTLEYTGSYETYKNCHIYADRYEDNSLYLLLYDDDGPILDITKNLNSPSLKENEAFIDTNNYPNLMKLINKYHLGKQKSKFKIGGYDIFNKYISYPCVEFDMDIVKEYMEVKE